MHVTVTSVNLYVRDPSVSIRFYVDLFGVPAIEEHPGFAMLPMAPQSVLGLWKREEVVPPVGPRGEAGSEMAITASDREAVMDIYRRWTARGVAVVQEPTECEFGFTFTAVDPDGHRLRVMALTPMP